MAGECDLGSHVSQPAPCNTLSGGEKGGRAGGRATSRATPPASRPASSSLPHWLTWFKPDLTAGLKVLTTACATQAVLVPRPAAPAAGRRSAVHVPCRFACRLPVTGRAVPEIKLCAARAHLPLEHCFGAIAHRGEGRHSGWSALALTAFRGVHRLDLFDRAGVPRLDLFDRTMLAMSQRSQYTQKNDF